VVNLENESPDPCGGREARCERDLPDVSGGRVSEPCDDAAGVNMGYTIAEKILARTGGIIPRNEDGR